MNGGPVSVVIPVHNGGNLLQSLLTTIERQTVAPLEVIVVDDGSTDGVPAIAERWGARVIAMGRQAGFAAAVNRGIEASWGEAVALINSDVELDPSWIGTLWDGIRALGVDFGSGPILRTAEPHLLDGAFDLICRGGCAWRAGSGHPLSGWQETEASIRLCSATAAIFRASVFRRVGLFEERFESYLEDVDFGLRCAAAGIQGGYFPGAVCRHRGSATLGPWSSKSVYLISRNQVFLVARHYSARLLLRWLWPILTAQILWGLLALRHGCGSAFIRGKFDGIRGFAALRSKLPIPPGIASLIVESERQIHRLQSRYGFDIYWKVYFLLVGVK